MALDTLTTEYNLKSSGAAKVQKDFKDTANVIHGASDQIKSGSSSLTKQGEKLFAMWDMRKGDQTSGINKFRMSMLDAAPAIGAVAGSLTTAALAAVGFSIRALNASAATDTMARRFAVSMGSLAKGKQTMEAIESHASRSAFSMEALASASSKLVAGQVSLQRYLPTIEKFALTVSGIDPSGLEDVAEAFVKARVGDFAAGLILLKKAGVTKSEFGQAAGAGFDGNKFMGSPAQFLAGLEKVVEERMSKSASLIAGGTETAMNQVNRIFARSMRQVGEEVSDEFLPAIKAGADELSLLVEGGVIRQVAAEFSDLLGSLTGGGGLASVVDGIVGIGATWLRAMKDWRNYIPGMQGIVLHDAIKGASDDIAKAKWEGLKKRYSNQFPDNGSPASNTRPGPKVKIEVEKLEEHKFLLKDIRDNTKKMVEVTNRILGGGAFGGAAFNPVNIARMGSGGGSKAEKAFKSMYDAIKDEVLQSIGTARQRGHLTGGRGI